MQLPHEEQVTPAAGSAEHPLPVAQATTGWIINRIVSERFTAARIRRESVIDRFRNGTNPYERYIG